MTTRFRRFLPLILSLSLFVAAAAGAAADDRGAPSFASFDRISVSPVGRETSRMVDAGVLVTDGFRHVVLNVAGELSGKVAARGRIGAILVPMIPELSEAIRNRRDFPIGGEIAADLSEGQSGIFVGDQTRLLVGFPRYRVMLFNTTDATAKVSVYAYRTP